MIERTLSRRWAIGGLVIAVVLSGLMSLASGAVVISPLQVIAIIGDGLGLTLPWEFTSVQQAVLLSIRLPRLVLGMLVGGVLAISGAAIQGLFRNPMADPALIGISSGAAFAAVAVVVLGATLLPDFSIFSSRYGLPIVAFIGGLTATWLVYHFATVNGRSDVAALLLAGIAINALFGSATGLLTYLANDEQLRTITFWSMGSLGGARWTDITIGLPFFLLTLGGLSVMANPLNILLLGEVEAGHLGLRIETVKIAVILLVATGVGAAVSLTGIIGFIGLVAPHLLRLSFGPDHRLLLPGSALLGASLLTLADWMERTLAVPAEIPIGILTGILGGPFFLYLLRRQQMRDGIPC